MHCPNISDWRRESVGDLTSAFNFAAPDTSTPTTLLTQPSPTTNYAQQPECVTEERTRAPYATPTDIPVPTQEPGARPSPSGLGPDPTLPAWT